MNWSMTCGGCTNWNPPFPAALLPYPVCRISAFLQDNVSLYISIIDELKRVIMDRVLESILEYAKLNAFINGIEDPLLRQILLYRYVDNLQWRQIAARVAGTIPPAASARSRNDT